MTALSWNGGPKGINHSSKHGSHFLWQPWVWALGILPRCHLGSLQGWDCCHHEPTEAFPKESFSHKPKLRAPRPTPQNRTGLEPSQCRSVQARTDSMCVQVILWWVDLSASTPFPPLQVPPPCLCFRTLQTQVAVLLKHYQETPLTRIFESELL